VDILVILSLAGIALTFTAVIIGVIVDCERRFAKIEKDVAELRAEVCAKIDLFWGFVQKNVGKLFPGSNPDGSLLAKLSAGTLSKQEAVILEKRLEEELYCDQPKHPVSLLLTMHVLHEHKKRLETPKESQSTTDS